MQFKKITHHWYKLYFLLSVLLVVFTAGIITAVLQLAPLKLLQQSVIAYKDWTTDDNYKHYTGIRPEKFIHPAREKGSGVIIYQPDKVQTGVTLISSMWNHQNGFNLINMDGDVLHSWRISFNNVWKNESKWPQKNISDWDTDIHGAILFSNGDIVFNFEHNGLVKIDRCSNVLWKLAHTTHHSVELDEDKNSMWVAGQQVHHKKIARFPMLEPLIKDDLILKINAQGEITKKLSILDIIYRSGYEALLLADGNSGIKRFAGDITHMNDVEVLSTNKAKNFPLFNAGDIMVSLRNLNLLVVIDGKSELIKWSMVGPFIHQHDPDFLDNGNIAVYDNRAEGPHSTGNILGGSRILEINPVTRKVTVAFEGSSDNKFYSYIRGKQQFLANGNILITEHGAGKIFETTVEGEIVWSYINRYDEDEVYQISQAIRYDKKYAKFLNE